MIAVDAGDAGGMVSGRLQRSFDLGPGQVVVLTEDETDAGACEVLLVGPVDPDRLSRVITPRIRWVHVLSTGVDGFPFDVIGDRVLTCSRGASAVAISEFVIAAMLAFEKHLPDVWISSSDDWRDIVSRATLGPHPRPRRTRRDRDRYRQARSRVRHGGDRLPPDARRLLPLPGDQADRRSSTRFWPRRTTW